MCNLKPQIKIPDTQYQSAESSPFESNRHPNQRERVIIKTPMMDRTNSKDNTQSELDDFYSAIASSPDPRFDNSKS